MGIDMSVAAENTAAVDPLFALLLGAFGSALLTLLGGMLGAWIQSKREHRKWLRERRFDAYREFMVYMSQLTDLLAIKITPQNANDVGARVTELMEQMTSCFEGVSILGPRAVNSAGQDWMGAATNHAEVGDTATRAALSRGRWRFLIAVGKELGSRNVGANPPKARPL